MIYLKRTLWLLGYPIMYLLSCVLFIVAVASIGVTCIFLYIKNGDIQGSVDYLLLCIKPLEWYNNIEPKEDEI